MEADILLNDPSASGGLKWKRMVVERELQALQTKGRTGHVVHGIPSSADTLPFSALEYF
jgi:hypothetical protein